MNGESKVIDYVTQIAPLMVSVFSVPEYSIFSAFYNQMDLARELVLKSEHRVKAQYYGQYCTSNKSAGSRIMLRCSFNNDQSACLDTCPVGGSNVKRFDD